MSTLAARKCVRHTAREAVARCASCSGDFCRECIVEHGGRILCATCLAKEAKQTAAAPRGRALVHAAGNALLTLASVVALWIAFYAFGQFLKALPPALHEGTVWKKLEEMN